MTDEEVDAYDNDNNCYDQLDFCRNEGWDHFLYNKCSVNTNENNDYRDNDDTNQYLEPDNDTNQYTTNITNQPVQSYQKQLILPEQLEYRFQNPNDIIFPIEQVNSLYYKNPIQKPKITSKVKKKMTQAYQAYKFPSKSIKKPKTVKPKQPTKSDLKQSYHSSFRLNPSLNAKGLFDPVLKVHELDNPSRTQKQRIDRLEKIKNYEIRYGKKVKKVELYKNYFDACEDIENMKNEIDVKRHKYTRAQLKEKDEIQKFMADIANNQVRPKNLEFNFSKYENKIQSLEQEIENERKMRMNTNKKYKRILDACVQEEEIAKRKVHSVSMKQRKRMNSRIQSRYKGKKGGTKLNSYIINTGRKNHSAGKIGFSRHNLIKTEKESIRNQTEARIKAQAKLIAKEPLDMMDKEIDALCKDILIQQKRMIKPSHNTPPSYINTNNLSKNNVSSDKNTASNIQYQQVPQVPHNTNQDTPNYNMENINKYIYFPNNSIIESSIAYEIFNNQTNTINTMNKMKLLSNINHSIENYSKGLPQLLDKVTKTIKQINQANIFNETTHPIIKNATKSSGQITQLHIDEIIKGIIDTLTTELVYDLQAIENKKNKINRKENFALFVSNYFSHYKELCSIEDDVSKKLIYRSQRGPLAPYIPIKEQRQEDYNNIHIEAPKYKVNDFFIENCHQSSIETMMLITSQEKIKRKEQRTYVTALPGTITENCQEYVKEYIQQDSLNKMYMIPNEQAIYDEIVKEEINKIMHQEIDNYVNQLDDCATSLFNKEINQ